MEAGVLYPFTGTFGQYAPASLWTPATSFPVPRLQANGLEVAMDRRLFLTGILGIAGVTAIGTFSRPGSALAGMPETKGGILDALDDPVTEELPSGFTGEDGDADLEPIQYGRRRRQARRQRRRQRRRSWRRVCRNVWRHGRRQVRCYRKRVWVWFWI